MNLKSLHSIFCGNLVYPPEGSYKIHKIEKNGKNIANDIGFKIDLGINVQNEIVNDKNCNKQNIKHLKSWSISQKRFTNELVITGKLFNNRKKVMLRINMNIIKKQIKKNLIITRRNRYYLIGPPIPNNQLCKMFEKFWMITKGGFPKKIEEFLKRY